jgi:hypothetical protein
MEMKKVFLLGGLVMLLATPFGISSCTKAELDQALQSTGLSDADIVSGLKSALNVGTDSSVHKTNRLDGYYKNLAIKILFPSDAQNIIDVVSAIPGGQGYVDNVVLTMNRAAEDAAKEAKPIFVDAVTSMTITDGKNILLGDSVAATNYLRTKTYVSLKTLYKPKISSSMDKVGASSAWSAITNVYNNIPFVKPVNTDLNDYVTDKALTGLFKMVENEEKLIRKDPTARVTDILAKVFKEQDKK